MHPGPRRYLPGLAETIGLVAAWGCITIAAGHGIGPIGLLLLLGFSQEPLAAFAGWGVAALPFVARRLSLRWLYGAALACLTAGCLAAIAFSEIRPLTGATALPFLALAGVQIWRLAVGREEESASVWRTLRATGDERVRWPRGARPTNVRPMHDYLSDAGIRGRLDAERRALLARIEDVPTDVLAARPSPDRWSVAEVLEHLARIETGVLRLLEMKGSAPPPSDAPAPAPEAILTPEIGARVRDRSWRIEAPERVRPVGGVAPDEALRQLAGARERLLAAFAAADRDALDRATHPHPVIGPLTLRSWVALTADHEARHAAQIGEIVEQVACEA